MDTEFSVKFNTSTDEKRGRPKSDDFSESPSSTKRRKLLEIKEMFTAVEIREEFLRSLNVKERKKGIECQWFNFIKCKSKQW